MFLRVGKVTNIYPSTGRIKVLYEDEKSASMPIPMLTMNNEYSMPAVGDKVVAVHMGNGSSKGFVLGTYYGGGTQPKASGGYRKDFGGGAYVVCRGGAYELHADEINLKCGDHQILIKEDMEIAASTVKVEATGGDVEIQADNIKLVCSYGEITVEELMKRLERIEDQLGIPHEI